MDSFHPATVVGHDTSNGGCNCWGPLTIEQLGWGQQLLGAIDDIDAINDRLLSSSKEH
jgi:hypothetical protein